MNDFSFTRDQIPDTALNLASIIVWALSALQNIFPTSVSIESDDYSQPPPSYGLMVIESRLTQKLMLICRGSFEVDEQWFTDPKGLPIWAYVTARDTGYQSIPPKFDEKVAFELR
jgi:hypothetical protein